MATCSAVLTFVFVDEILWCDHSNKTSFAVLLHGTICSSIFYKIKFRIILKFLSLALLGVEGLRTLKRESGGSLIQCKYQQISPVHQARLQLYAPINNT